MNKYRITAGVAALLMGMASPAAFFDADTVSCEKVYDVRLSAETVEIDINDIPENREVLVGINLDNNPGMQSMGFWLRKDSRLSCEEICPYEFDGSKRGITHKFYDNRNVIAINVIPVIDFENGELTYENGVLLKMKLVLPENLNSGDFYEVKPLIDFNDDPGMDQASFLRANSFDALFGKENFAEPVSGGIRITGQKNEPEPSKEPEPEPSPSPSPSPSPEQKPSDQQAGNNNSQPASDNKSGNKQETQAVTSTTSEVVSTSVSETVDTSAVTAETSVSESETAVTLVSETEVRDETTTVSETTVTEAASEEKKENKNRSKYLLGVALAAVILAGVGTWSIRHKK